MSVRSLVPALAFVFLAALCELFGAFWSPWAAVVVALTLGPAFISLIRVLHFEDLPLWATATFPALGTLLGAAVAVSGLKTTAGLLLAPLLTAGGSLAWTGARRINSKRCSLCSARLGSTLAFQCPRCGLLACEARCWTAEFVRCRLCVQNEVPVFTPDARWWDRQLGARFEHGVCQYCHAAASERDLRACRRCGRPQCRDCWDHLNGQCTRCQWIIPDLPKALRGFLEEPRVVTSSGGRGSHG